MRLDIRTLTAAHYKQPFIVMGNSHSLNMLDLGKIHRANIPTMGCNRILETYNPDYVVVCDRRAYVDQIKLLTLYRGKRLFCTGIFDPKIRSHGVPVQTPPPFDWYGWRVATTPKNSRLRKMAPEQVINAASFEQPFVSAACIAFPMIQMALVMGANPIGLVGIDLKWPKDGPTHSFGDGRKRGCEPLPKRTYKCFEKLHAWLRARPDQRIVNLSPVGAPTCEGVVSERSPMDRYFDRQEFSAFIGGKA